MSKQLLGKKSNPWLALVISVSITFFVFFVFNNYLNEFLNVKFQNESEEIAKRINERLLEYEQVLRGAQGLFAASIQVDRDEWHLYIMSQKISERFPGIQAIGFSKVIGNTVDLKIHEDNIRQEGFEDYSVHPQGIRDVYHSIIYVEPFDQRNQQAFGLDMSFEENRKSAMESARDTGEPAITRKITLVQEITSDVQAGFLMMLPVYKNDLPHDSLQEKRENLDGYVYAAFRMNDFMSGILGDTTSDVNFQIYDSNVNEENLMYDYGSANEISSGVLTPKILDEGIISLGDKSWVVKYEALETLSRGAEAIVPYVILIAGLSMSGFVFYTFNSFNSAAMRIEKLVRATEQISRGEDFKIDADLKNPRHETSVLANAFTEMQKNLKVKNQQILENFNQLTKSNERLENFKTALDAHAIVSMTDLDGNITYVNDQFCKISKYDRNELIGKDHRVLKSGYHNQKFYKEMWDTITSGKIWNGLLKNKAKDGTFYWVWSTIAPLLDENGNIDSYIAIRTDITKQKEDEQTIQNQIKQMEIVNKSKEEFTAMISHELKTPITPIVLWTDALREPGMLGELNPEQLDAVEKISACADQLQTLVTDMFDVYKLDLKKLTFSYDEIVVRKMLEEVTQTSRKLIGTKGITLQNYVKDDFVIISDKRRVIQVLRNLINNAIDFVPAKTGKIEINCIDRGEFLEFSVIDNGKGISKEEQQNLFKKFYQTDTTYTREHGGSGLGLTICKGIVEGLGGKIWVESDIGKGAKFFFTLPKKKEAPQQVQD